MTKQNIKDLISEKGAKNIANIIRENLGNDVGKHLDRLGINAEEIIRYMPICQEFVAARSERNISVKEAAAHMKVPQYRLKAIEDGTFSLLDPHIFRKYCGFLDLDAFVESWCQENRKLADKLGI